MEMLQESSKTQSAPALKRPSKSISWNKKGHQAASCWYSELCSFCGKKGHLELLVGRSKPHAISLNVSREILARLLPQVNKKFRGT
jgi:hypothetical protein